MRKIRAVFKREYLQAVRKKSFLIMTVLTPFLFGGLMIVPSLFAVRGIGGKHVAVVDGTGRLGPAVAEGLKGQEPADLKGMATQDFEKPGRGRRSFPGNVRADYVNASGRDAKEAAKPFLERLHAEKDADQLDGVFVVPAGAFADPSLRMTYYSRSSTDLMTQERLGRVVNRALSRERLAGHGLDPAEIDTLLRDLRVEAVQLTKAGEEKTGGEMNFLVGFAFVLLIFLPVLLYGQEVMRGIIQEKTDRVVEILVSSMTPFELLSGKILGMAAVGLTQIAIWVTMGGVLAAYGAAAALAAGVNLGQFLRPALALWFIVFFVLGYLINVCIYAVGGAIVTSEKEAQQVITPVIFVMMVPWFLVMPIIMSPDSAFSTALSLIPIYTPITMFIRVLVSEPPLWQVGLSILLAVGTILGFFWVTAKIFRVGLLATGKRPTIPELWRWLKVA
ncbi:MAG: ABC transporter permease [Thermoanaerobaculia bacterium]